ncbi:hypothetical protein [Pseudomonas faucium]|uniref:hypothetical protein n=1 Tax=Pseudomonas faucium TaxID=2740518 RepID=UPI0039C24370
MKAKTANVSLSNIAGDALEFVRYGKDQTRWLAALMTSIQLDLTYNKGRTAIDLASLGQYLGEDCANYLDDHAGKLQSQLDAAEVSQ